jgi:hypothetical protein
MDDPDAKLEPVVYYISESPLNSSNLAASTCMQETVCASVLVLSTAGVSQVAGGVKMAHLKPVGDEVRGVMRQLRGRTGNGDEGALGSAPSRFGILSFWKPRV